jgi:hypothetical protein
MTDSSHVLKRLGKMVRRRNGELVFEAALKGLFGVVFSLITFGLIFWIGWFSGLIFFAGALNLHAWQFGAILTGVFFVVATWSAWRRVNPLAGLRPLSDEEKIATLISQAAGGLGLFSPRHASAGFAVVLIGGPASILEAIACWSLRLPARKAILQEAALLLETCPCPLERVQTPAAALLLKRLALITVIALGESAALSLTDKGMNLLSTSRKKRQTEEQR